MTSVLGTLLWIHLSVQLPHCGKSSREKDAFNYFLWCYASDGDKECPEGVGILENLFSFEILLPPPKKSKKKKTQTWYVQTFRINICTQAVDAYVLIEMTEVGICIYEREGGIQGQRQRQIQKDRDKEREAGIHTET